MKKAQLAVVWALVGIPLLYGVIQTMAKAAALFN
jgi:hypothetical protein